MKVASGKLVDGTEWNFVIHSDGKVSFGIVARDRLVRPNKALTKLPIVEVDRVLPVEVIVSGIKCRPRLVLRVYAKPSQKSWRRIREAEIKQFKKQKPSPK